MMTNHSTTGGPPQELRLGPYVMEPCKTSAEVDVLEAEMLADAPQVLFYDEDDSSALTKP
jgi:hypothetical protein